MWHDYAHICLNLFLQFINYQMDNILLNAPAGQPQRMISEFSYPKPLVSPFVCIEFLIRAKGFMWFIIFVGNIGLTGFIGFLVCSWFMWLKTGFIMFPIPPIIPKRSVGFGTGNELATATKTANTRTEVKCKNQCFVQVLLSFPHISFCLLRRQSSTN